MKIAVAYLAIMVMVVGDELRSFVARGHSDDLSRALGVLQQRQRWIDAGLPADMESSQHEYGTVTHFPPKMRKKSLSDSGGSSSNIFDSVASIPPSEVWRSHVAREPFTDEEDDDVDKRMKLKRSMFRERERKIEEEEQKRRRKKKRMMMAMAKKSVRRSGGNAALGDWGDTESELRTMAQRRFLDAVLHGGGDEGGDAPSHFDTSSEIYGGLRGDDVAALVDVLRNNMAGVLDQQHYMEGEGPGGGESRKRVLPLRKRTMWQDGFRYALGDTPDKRMDDRESWYESEDVPGGGPRETWWSYGNLSPELLTALSEIKAAEERESDEEESDEDEGVGDDEEESDERELYDERKREQDPWFPAFDVKKRGRHALWSAYNGGYDVDDRLLRKRLIPLKRKRSSAFRERNTRDPGVAAFMGTSKRAAPIKRSPEEPIEVHKRMVKKSSETQPHVLKELKSILADEKDEKRVIKKREDGNQSDDSGEDAVDAAGVSSSLGAGDDQDDSDEEDLSEEDFNNIFYSDVRKRSINRKRKRSWDEYFGIDKRQGRSVGTATSRNHKMKKMDDEGSNNNTKSTEVAKTTPDDNATMAPLLPTPLPQTDNTANSWMINRYFKSMAAAMSSRKKRTVSAEKKAEDSMGDEEEGGSGQTSLQTMAQKLEAIENLMLEEALELVEGHGAGDGSDREEKREEILHRLDAAQSLVKMREALAEFEDSLGRIREDEKIMKAAEHQMESGNGDDDDKKKKKKDGDNKQNLFEALHVMAPQATKRVSASSEEYSKDSKDECPIFSEIALLCSELSKAAGDPQRELVGACSRHIMCYACDYAYKEGPRLPCDLIFMRDAHDICGDDLRCRSTAAQMHGTLRQRAPNMEHSSAPVCLSEPCIRAYRRR